MKNHKLVKLYAGDLLWGDATVDEVCKGLRKIARGLVNPTVHLTGYDCELEVHGWRPLTADELRKVEARRAKRAAK